jgi:hypothetical protein
MIKRDEHEQPTSNDDVARTCGAAEGERSMAAADGSPEARALGGAPSNWWNWIQLVPEHYFIACRTSGVLETLATIDVGLDVATGKETEIWTVNSAMANASQFAAVDELMLGLTSSAPTSLLPIPTENVVKQSTAATVTWSPPVTGHPYPKEGTTFYGGEYVYYVWLTKHTEPLALNIQTKINAQGKWQIDRIVWHNPQVNGSNIKLKHSPVVRMNRVISASAKSYPGTCIWVETPME